MSVICLRELAQKHLRPLNRPHKMPNAIITPTLLAKSQMNIHMSPVRTYRTIRTFKGPTLSAMNPAMIRPTAFRAVVTDKTPDAVVADRPITVQ